MKFWKKRKMYKVEKIFVVETSILSDYNDGSGMGPRKSVKCYFLGIKKDGKYYELFSEQLLNTEETFFNMPVIRKLEPLTKWLRSEDTKRISKEELFYFILRKNVEVSVEER